ncbi:MAG: Elongation factor T [Anaerolinea thermophila]|uniref:Elongation factor Ts n=1 Tax=Anaerolinea thermophila TaxID=167964 RepID=A0A117LGQ8_9CHLR|nr:MAG: Elongation factor T [Anaerolinea thermophila]
MEITTAMIKQLREESGAGVLDCRKALQDTDGDFEKAKIILRDKGLATASKRADRTASEGIVEIYSHGDGRVGVMVEVNCETDFVGRSEDFRNFAHEVALQIAGAYPLYVSDNDIPEEVIKEQESKATAKAKEEGKPDTIVARIVEGYLKKFKDENVLLRQQYIRDDSLTIQDLLNNTISKTGENIIIRRFARFTLGESSEMDEE